MKFGIRWRRSQPRLASPAADLADPGRSLAIFRKRQRGVATALIPLAAWLAFSISYRFPVMPYLLLAILITSLWRLQVGVLCLVVSLGILMREALRQPPWQTGLDDLLRMAVVGLLSIGARAVLDQIERQRITERQLIDELSRTVEQLRESEQRQVQAVEALAARHEELQAAQEQLLRSERLAALGQFSATMAHELRNPLNVVKLSAHYVTTHLRSSEEKVQRNLSHMQQSVDRACSIIDDLLAFSRLPPPRLRPTPLNELVRGAIMALSIPERVTVTWELNPDLPPVLADARQIEQAVSNLGLNALQAMPEGGCLTVSTRREGERVEIVVDDTGPGVPPELQEKVLEPFFSTKVTGTGLGLPLVREIVAAHGGEFTLHSLPGEGAHFTLALPLLVPARHSNGPLSGPPGSLCPAPGEETDSAPPRPL